PFALLLQSLRCLPLKLRGLHPESGIPAPRQHEIRRKNFGFLSSVRFRLRPARSRICATIVARQAPDTASDRRLLARPAHGREPQGFAGEGLSQPRSEVPSVSDDRTPA